MIATIGGTRRRLLARGRRQRRNPAVRRIDDDRRSLLAVHDRQDRTAIEPRLVVRATDVCFRRRSAAIAIVTFDGLPFVRHRFLRGELELTGELGGALERCQRGETPY